MKPIQVISHGVTRLVVLIGPYAIKFPSTRNWKCFLMGLLCNQNEAGVWKYQEDSTRELLCPVLALAPGGFFLVMKRVIPITFDEYQLVDGWVFGGAVMDIDNHRENFGWLEGRIVLLDYGNHC